MTDEQLRELRQHITDTSSNNTGFWTALFVVLILLNVINMPNTSRVESIIQEKLDISSKAIKEPQNANNN